MKRCRVIALCLVSTLLLAGCGESKTTSSGRVLPDGVLEDNVTIHVLENDTAIEKGYLDELLKAFNEKYKDHGITAVDANMDQYLDLAQDGPFGYGPDVLYQANDVLMKYVKGQHILALDVEKMECYSQIPDIAWNAYRTTINDKTYTCGIPVNVQAPMLYYRKDALPNDWKDKWDDNKNDVPDMIEDWTAMYEYSKEIHAADPEKYGYMKSLYDSYFSFGYLFTYGGYVFGDNNTNPDDIGLASGDSYKGVNVLLQMAGSMNEECIDDTVTRNAPTKIAQGTYFATVTTPDMYTTYRDALSDQYQTEGLSKEEADKKATENLILTTLPQIPVTADLTDKDADLQDTKVMGGINGYAVSAYTKYPDDCIAFAEFAASYEMIKKRNELLGIAPARNDVAAEVGGTAQKLYEQLSKGTIVLMPSITEVGQIWKSSETFFTDVAKDPFRPEAEQKYTNEEAIKAGLSGVCQDITDAITTLESK